MIAVAVAVKEVGIVVAAGLAAVVVLAPASRVRGRGDARRAGADRRSCCCRTSGTPPSSSRARPAGAARPRAGRPRSSPWAWRRWLFDRRPALLPLAAAAALPFRIPIESGGQTSNLLVPLYFVIAAGALAFAVPRLRGARGRPGSRRRAARWSGCCSAPWRSTRVQAAYSGGLRARRSSRSSSSTSRSRCCTRCCVRALDARAARGAASTSSSALALVFGAVGFVEYATRTLLLNPKVIASNQFQTYFRVNSLFFDPNIYGRFLALVMLLLAAVMLWTARRRRWSSLGRRCRAAVGGSGSDAVRSRASQRCWSGSWCSRRCAGARAGRRPRWPASWRSPPRRCSPSPARVKVDLGSCKSVDKATSGRLDLVKGGGRLFERPSAVRAGGRAPTRRSSASTSACRASARPTPRTRSRSRSPPSRALLGLLVYLALLVAAFIRLLLGGARAVARPRGDRGRLRRR